MACSNLCSLRRRGGPALVCKKLSRATAFMCLHTFTSRVLLFAAPLCIYASTLHVFSLFMLRIVLNRASAVGWVCESKRLTCKRGVWCTSAMQLSQAGLGRFSLLLLATQFIQGQACEAKFCDWIKELFFVGDADDLIKN